MTATVRHSGRREGQDFIFTKDTVTDRHRPFREIVSELFDGAAGRTVTDATGRHRLRNPSLGRISLYVLRDVFDYSCFNYKVSGLMLISLITWGLKEVTLSLLVGYYFHLYS